MSDKSKLIKIYTASDFLCILFRTHLEENGIEAYVKSQSESARLAGFGMLGMSEVFVLENKLEKASALLIDFEARQADES
ncbi:MAG: DUF2007 domain-containing protein [Chitinophagales bacterium]|nr:DUF2007 domain-containing protein [Chitinophagales bacterium]